MLRPRIVTALAVASVVVALSVLGIVLAQNSASVSTEVRINARQLDDGRVEFALQQREGNGWGERMLVRSRYLPADVGHDRWLNSSAFMVTLEIPESTSGEDLLEESGPVNSVSDSPPPPRSLSWVSQLNVQEFDHQILNGWDIWRLQVLSDSTLTYVTCRPGSGELHWSAGANPSIWEQLDEHGVSAMLWLFGRKYVPGLSAAWLNVCDVGITPGIYGAGDQVEEIPFSNSGSYICSFLIHRNQNRWGSPTNFVVRLGERLMVNEIAEWERYERLVNISEPGVYFLEVEADGEWTVYCGRS